MEPQALQSKGWEGWEGLGTPVFIGWEYLKPLPSLRWEEWEGLYSKKKWFDDFK